MFWGQLSSSNWIIFKETPRNLYFFKSFCGFSKFFQLELQGWPRNYKNHILWIISDSWIPLAPLGVILQWRYSHFHVCFLLSAFLTNSATWWCFSLKSDANFCGSSILYIYDPRHLEFCQFKLNNTLFWKNVHSDS